MKSRISWFLANFDLLSFRPGNPDGKTIGRLIVTRSGGIEIHC